MYSKSKKSFLAGACVIHVIRVICVALVIDIIRVIRVALVIDIIRVI